MDKVLGRALLKRARGGQGRMGTEGALCSQGGSSREASIEEGHWGIPQRPSLSWKGFEQEMHRLSSVL